MGRAFKWALAIVALLLVGAYALGFYFFSNYFMPRTFVNGVDLSYTKISDLYKNYTEKSKRMNIEIQARDQKEIFDVNSLDYVDRLDEGQRVPQSPFIWFLSSFAKKEYELGHKRSFDRAKFDQQFNNLKVIKSQNRDSQDAKINFDGKVYFIEKEIYGNKLRVDEFKKELLSAFESDEKVIDLEKDGLYILPKVTSEDPVLVETLRQYNHLNSFVITYDFDDRKEELKGPLLVGLYKLNSENMMVPDVEKVHQYIVNLAKKYDTFKTTRDFNATGGFKVRIVGGIYGWLTDVPKSTEELVAALEKTQSATLKPVYKLEAVSRKVDDISNTYVEIDLARQKTWVYRDGQLVLETNVVSGNPNMGNATPTGVGKIWSRETDRYLTGADYKSYVHYWLPFNWSGCGLHDANWRSSFGGNIYRSNGSHGCVNVPPRVMKSLYDSTFHGMPVVVYDSSRQKIVEPTT